jgi:hypothetical protein
MVKSYTDYTVPGSGSYFLFIVGSGFRCLRSFPFQYTCLLAIKKRVPQRALVIGMQTVPGVRTMAGA